MLKDELKSLDYQKLCSPEVANLFRSRLDEGSLTRDENPETHFSTYFLPYDPETKKVFIVHHKKSGLWIAPGGHIDREETLKDTVIREIEEELGTPANIGDIGEPFLLAITEITNPKQVCRRHFDVWFLFRTNESGFNIDPREFHETRWVTIEEARQLVTDSCNLEALDQVSKIA